MTVRGALTHIAYTSDRFHRGSSYARTIERRSITMPAAPDKRLCLGKVWQFDFER